MTGLGMFARYLFGTDFFISYARKDGTRYVAALARRLQERRFSVYYDSYDTQPGQHIPDRVLNTLDAASALVIVATAAASESAAMKREIARFASHGRQIFIIDVGQSARRAVWWSIVDGMPVQPEAAAAAESSEPDAGMVGFLENAFAYLRRNQRQQIVSGVFVAAIAVALVVLWRLNGRIAVASRDLGRATQELTKVAGDRDQLSHDVARIRDELQTASTEREQQQRLAEVSRWVTQAEASRAVLSYTAAPDIVRSLVAARVFQKASMPSEAFAAVAESLSQVPASVGDVRIRGGFRAHALTPDRRVLAILSNRDQVLFVNPASGAQLHPALDVGSGVTGLILSADGARLGAITKQNGLRIWDVRARRVLTERPCGRRATLSAHGGLLAVECNDKIEVIDLSGKRRWDAIEHPYMFGEFRFTPDERYLTIIVQDEADSVILYEVADTLRSQRTSTSCLGGAQKVSLSDDGRFVLRSRRDVGEGVKGANSVRVCDVPSLRQRVALPHTYVTEERISPDGRYVATLERGTIQLWNTTEGQLVAAVRPAVPPRSIIFSGDSRYLLTGSGWLIGVADGQVATVWMPRDIPEFVSPSAEGNRFLTGDRRAGLLHIWQAQSIQRSSGYSFASRATVAGISADGKYFGVAAVDPTPDGRMLPSITVWSAETGASVLSRQAADGDQSSARTLAFSYRVPEALVLERRWDDETSLEVISLTDGRRRYLYAPRKGFERPPRPFSLSPRGSWDEAQPVVFSEVADHPDFGWIGLERDDKVVRIRSLSKPRVILERTVSDPEECRLDDHGRIMVCPPTLYRIDGRAPVRAPAGSAILASRVLQAEGRVAVALSGKAGWRLIEWPSGRVRVTQAAPADAVAISEDTQFVAAAAAGWVRIWEVSANRLMAEQRITGSVMTLAFSPDGRSVLATTGGRAQAWFWRADDLIAAGCQLLARDTAIPEWRSLFSVDLLSTACPRDTSAGAR